MSDYVFRGSTFLNMILIVGNKAIGVKEDKCSH